MYISVMTMVMTTVVDWVSEGCSVPFWCSFCCAKSAALFLCPAAPVRAEQLRAVCFPLPPCTLHLRRCFWRAPSQPVGRLLHRIHLSCQWLHSWEFQLRVPQPGWFAGELDGGRGPALGPAALCWFSRIRTDPLCGTGTPGLMLHRALEWFTHRFGMFKCPEIPGKCTRSFQSAGTTFPGGKRHVSEMQTWWAFPNGFHSIQL